jgi:hypothetical protein
MHSSLYFFLQVNFIRKLLYSSYSKVWAFFLDEVNSPTKTETGVFRSTLARAKRLFFLKKTDISKWGKDGCDNSGMLEPKNIMLMMVCI